MKKGIISGLFILTVSLSAFSQSAKSNVARERISFNDGWRFFKYDSTQTADSLIYDVLPTVTDSRDDKSADAQPLEAVRVQAVQAVLKPWILPTGNSFLRDTSKHHPKPSGRPGADFPFVSATFDDSSWEEVDLPHDWAIEGPFYNGAKPKVGGGIGRLPSPGVGWYRKKLEISASDAGRQIYLDIDGAMSYAMVWLNGTLIGGWPYGYASWRVDLTPFVVVGAVNQLAIRVDNPPNSSRWYPGGGIYRNVWLTKTRQVHIGHWGTTVTTQNVSKTAATVNVAVKVVNDSPNDALIVGMTSFFALDENGQKGKKAAVNVNHASTRVQAGGEVTINATVVINKPRLWGPPPSQVPNRYVAVTTLRRNGKTIDWYETTFGIRSIQLDPNQGVLVNGERIFIKGVNQHHDLGALGAAFNVRAAERQLEMLRDMGCNAIRTAHNPPAPEFLDLTDKLGFLVVDEIFDVWERKKTPLDFHLIFPDWYEQDLRAFVRRDRNHPSVIVWSYGNEVGEQYTEDAGAALAKKLSDIIAQEDPTRSTTASMNFAKPDMAFSKAMDIISLNYQGEGIRDAPEYAGLTGIRTSPQFPAFHNAFPEKVIVSSENAAAVSTRGEYLFPVIEGTSAPVRGTSGGDPKNQYVSAYELYSVDFGSSADKVFASEDRHPYVAGGFVWSGWDYLGEPTPYYLSRSSYFGIIDLAGFKKDRYYLYQARWRPELPMVHILPHWNWPERIGGVTPVHVFTSGDEAELFLNGVSMGRKQKKAEEYRLRWDDVKYSPGELKVIAYRNGKVWSEKIVKTTDQPVKVEATVDHSTIKPDGQDLAFVTVRITDKNGLTVPQAKNAIKFTIEGPGEIVATDNGDPSDLTPFPSPTRNAFNGYCLAIVRSSDDRDGAIILKVESEGLEGTTVLVKVERLK